MILGNTLTHALPTYNVGMEWWKAVAGKAEGNLPEVEGISVDSRQLQPGWAFVAVPGAASDGHDYLDAAVATGAAALVVQADHAEAWQHLQRKLPLLIVDNTRAAAGPLAAAVYGHPSHQAARHWHYRHRR